MTLSRHTGSARGFQLFQAPCLTRNQPIFVLMGDKGTAEVAGRVDLAAVGVPQLMGRRLDYVRGFYENH